MMEKSWKDIFGKKTRLNWLESEVDILRRELDSYKNFRKKDDERNYEKITKCIEKTKFVEVQIEGAMVPLKNRIGTLEQQIADGMNREEEWKRRLAKIEWNMLREDWDKMNKEVYEVVPTKKIVGHCERLLVVAESEEESIQLAIKGVHFTFEQLPLHSHIAEWGESEIIATEWLM